MIIDQVQRYLDSICPSKSTVDGIATRLNSTHSAVTTALQWLIANKRVTSDDADGITQYQSVQLVRTVSRGFSGSMDGTGQSG